MTDITMYGGVPMTVEKLNALRQHDVSKIQWKLADKVRGRVKPDDVETLLVAAYLALRADNNNISSEIFAKFDEEMRDNIEKDMSLYEEMAKAMNDAVSKDELLAFFLFGEYIDTDRNIEPQACVCRLIARLLNVQETDSVVEIGNTHGAFIVEAAVCDIHTVYGDSFDTVAKLRADMLGVQLRSVEQDKVYDKSVIIHPIYDHKHADTVYDEIIHDVKLSKASAVFVLNGFTFSTKRSDVDRRKHIFDRIEAVIELPNGMCKSSMVSTSIIIVDNEPSNIQLIDAQMMYTGEGRRRYLSIDDIESINNMMHTDTEKAHTMDKSEIDLEKCIILPSHYYNVTAGRPMMNISEAIVSVYGRRELLNLNEYDNGLVFSGRDIKVLTEDTDISKARLVVLLDSSKLLAEYVSLFFGSPIGQDLISSISYTSTIPMWSKHTIDLLSVPEMGIDDQKKTIVEANSLKATIDDATRKLNSLFD